MCWRTSSNPIKRIANEDVPVIKIVYGKSKISANGFHPRSVYFPQYWAIDKPVPKIDITVWYALISWQINEGYHSYLPDEVSLEYNQNGEPEDERINIRHKKVKGHILDTVGIFAHEILVMECVIPKGTIYYVNEWGECVSEYLIVKGFHNVLDKYRS